MRIENKNMQAFLNENGVTARVKYLDKGSLKGTWRLYEPKTDWYNNTGLINRLTALGFTNYDGEPLTKFSGNGGTFQIFARATNVVLPTTNRGYTYKKQTVIKAQDLSL
jgi:2-phospho-L-lactate transferase/gluconeogenesis factor (CofD/UPF0052 family)